MAASTQLARARGRDAGDGTGGRGAGGRPAGPDGWKMGCTKRTWAVTMKDALVPE